tara:strand:- start:14 stop:145 length:132 start_codon:yes stop_codon:yes gene_type:complete
MLAQKRKTGGNLEYIFSSPHCLSAEFQNEEKRSLTPVVNMAVK